MGSSPIDRPVAVITGAGSGIGAAVAVALAGRGTALTLAGRRRERLDETARLLPAATPVLIQPTDVGEEAEVERMVAATLERFGRIDVLVCNAGLGVFGGVEALAVEDFDRALRVNLRGSFLCLRSVLPHFYEQGSGTVIAVSSVAGRHGFNGGGAYCASKFGLMGLMECAFQEARSHNVRVVTLTPGSVATPFFDEANVPVPDPSRLLQPEDVAATVLLALDLPERATVRELDIRPTNPR